MEQDERARAIIIARDALAEKYSVPKGTIDGIFESYIQEMGGDVESILVLDWKDMDAIVQEGLVELGR